MRTRLGRVALFGIVAVSGACNSRDKPVCEDTVITPAGPRPRACVHQVPDDGVVSIDDGGTAIVTVDGGVVATYPPCPCDAGASFPLPEPLPQ